MSLLCKFLPIISILKLMKLTQGNQAIMILTDSSLLILSAEVLLKRIKDQALFKSIKCHFWIIQLINKTLQLIAKSNCHHWIFKSLQKWMIEIQTPLIHTFKYLINSKSKYGNIHHQLLIKTKIREILCIHHYLLSKTHSIRK